MCTANKQRTYRKHTLNYTTVVNYLQIVSNSKHRKALTKLRESDQKLNIEIGGHTTLSLSKRIGLCKLCNVDIENKRKNIFFRGVL